VSGLKKLKELLACVAQAGESTNEKEK
jgi:hypothetical protein